MVVLRLVLLLPSKPLRPTAGATKMVALEASGAGKVELFGLAKSSEGGGRVPGAKASATTGSQQVAGQVLTITKMFDNK